MVMLAGAGVMSGSSIHVSWPTGIGSATPTRGSRWHHHAKMANPPLQPRKADTSRPGRPWAIRRWS